MDCSYHLHSCLVNDSAFDNFPHLYHPVRSLVAACRTRVLETGRSFLLFLAHLAGCLLCLPFTLLTLHCSACRTWFRHSGAPGLPGGSSELERCSGLLPVEGQETAHRGGVGVGCTWGAARYTVYTLKS